jgi:hypothetical protein
MEAFLKAAAETPIYGAAVAITLLLKEHLPLRLGEETTTIFFGIGLGFGGLWFGGYAWTRKWVLIGGILFCLFGAGYLYVLETPEPVEMLLFIEKFLFGWASFFFFWMARGAGVHVVRSFEKQKPEPS